MTQPSSVKALSEGGCWLVVQPACLHNLDTIKNGNMFRPMFYLLRAPVDGECCYGDNDTKWLQTGRYACIRMDSTGQCAADVYFVYCVSEAFLNCSPSFIASIGLACFG